MILKFKVLSSSLPLGPLLQVLRPGELDHDSPEEGGRQGIQRVIRQPDGHEAKNQIGTAPVPCVLMKNGKGDKNNKENNGSFFHAILGRAADRGVFLVLLGRGRRQPEAG